MEVAWLDPGTPRWSAALSGMAHDFYHLPGYLELCAAQERGRAQALLCVEAGATLLLPLIIRTLPDDDTFTSPLLDATSPYGYPGPLLDLPAGWGEDRRLGFLHSAIATLAATLRERGIISAFIRFHPMLAVPLAPFGASGELVRHGDTVSIDLTADAGTIWRGMRSNHRNGIAKALRSGHAAEIDAHWDHLDVFVAAYRETMDRVGALPSYYFERGYYPALRRALGGRIHLAVARIGGRIASAGLFTEIGGIVQYHLGGTFDEFLPCYPHKLLFHHVALWAKQRGDRNLHLGGGVGGGEDSLFHFKAGFSPGRHTFHTWRLVTDQPAYDAAVEAWRRRGGSDPGTGRFFPAYRRPLPPSPR